MGFLSVHNGRGFQALARERPNSRQWAQLCPPSPEGEASALDYHCRNRHKICDECRTSLKFKIRHQQNKVSNSRISPLYTYCSTCFDELAGIFGRLRDRDQIFPSQLKYTSSVNAGDEYHVVGDLEKGARVYTGGWSMLSMGSRELNAFGIFVGVNDRPCQGNVYDGGACLLSLPSETPGKVKYAYVANYTYAFETESVDPITEFYSFIGPNAVSYPVSVSARRVWFMCDKVSVLRADFGEPDTWDTHTPGSFEDAYRRFYNLRHTGAFLMTPFDLCDDGSWRFDYDELFDGRFCDSDFYPGSDQDY
jgi:hypothetical protein